MPTSIPRTCCTTLQSGRDTISTYIHSHYFAVITSKFLWVETDSALSSWHTLLKTSRNALRSTIHDIHPHCLRCQKSSMSSFRYPMSSLNVFHQSSQYFLFFKTTTTEAPFYLFLHTPTCALRKNRIKVARYPRSTNLESKLIEFFVLVNF